MNAVKESYVRDRMIMSETNHKYIEQQLDYRGNVYNSLSVAFYKKHGVKDIKPAYERQSIAGASLMFCKHCIRYSFGWCSRTGQKIPYSEPLYLLSADGKRFRLHFNCKECEMSVIAE